MLRWDWEPQSPACANFGNANQWTVNAGLTSLARETAQNSNDARVGSEPADLVYTFIRLTGERRRAFESALRWDGQLLPYLEAMQASAKGAVASGQFVGCLEALHRSTALVLRRIADHGCRGLAGPEFADDGPDFAPVIRAFIRQDLPNSYLHRPFVRCRSLAQALLDVAAPACRETSVSADRVNDFARAVNLATAGAPPEAEVGHIADDVVAYLARVHEPALGPFDRETLPTGPACRDTSDGSLDRASAIAARCAGTRPHHSALLPRRHDQHATGAGRTVASAPTLTTITNATGPWAREGHTR